MSTVYEPWPPVFAVRLACTRKRQIVAGSRSSKLTSASGVPEAGVPEPVAPDANALGESTV